VSKLTTALHRGLTTRESNPANYVVDAQASGSGKWRRRRARWLMAERTYITGIWRASQAAYRPWATTAHPRATPDMIPPTTKVWDSSEPFASPAAVLRDPPVLSAYAWHDMHIVVILQTRLQCLPLYGERIKQGRSTV